MNHTHNERSQTRQAAPVMLNEMSVLSACRLMRIAFVVKMKVSVGVALMRVRVDMHTRTMTQSEIQNPAAKKNDHQRDQEFENRSDRAGNCYSKNDDQYAGGQERYGMADAPEHAYKTRTPNRSLLADNCGYRHQVIGFGRVL